MDGEYHNDLQLKVKEKGNSLQVGAAFQANFIKPNDKLGAHKVVSIALHIQVPENKNVVLYGTSCNVSANGIYKNLNISLNDGQCFLGAISETTEVRTQSGDISLQSMAGTVEAESKYGIVSTNPIDKGDNSYTLKTVTGNIHLSKTE